MVSLSESFELVLWSPVTICPQRPSQIAHGGLRQKLGRYFRRRHYKIHGQVHGHQGSPQVQKRTEQQRNLLNFILICITDTDCSLSLFWIRFKVPKRIFSSGILGTFSIFKPAARKKHRPNLPQRSKRAVPKFQECPNKTRFMTEYK